MRKLQKLLILAVIFVPFALAISGDGNVRQLPFKITHHNLHIQLNPAGNTLLAEDQITLILQQESRAPLELLLRRGLRVRGVWCGKKALNYSISEQADPSHFEADLDSEDVNYYGRAQVISIAIPEKAIKKPEITLKISYQGVVRDSLAGADFSREYVAEQITAFVGPEGVYLGPEGIYYPALPDQLFTYAVTVTLPEEFQSVSEGIDRQPLVQNAKRTETWECVHPIDGFHVIAGKYQVNSIQHEGVKISTYFFPDTTELSKRYLQACAGYISLYDSLLGPYPFEKFAVVENFFATGYGMPSFTLLGSEVIRLPFIISISLGHEVCHNWWGNSVYVNYESGNWCEGLTTYCADYLYKEQQSPAEAREYRMGLLRDYTAYTHENNDFALSDFVQRHNPAQRAVGYGKSAMVYHMLRRQVGDQAFWSALKQFYRDNIYKFATWGDVQKAFENVTGQQLGGFFDQWVGRIGAPQLAIQSPEMRQIPDGWQITLDLAQKQNDDPYILDLPVQVSGETGDSSFVVAVRRATETVNLTTRFHPSSFSVDPNFDLFRRLERAEIAPTLAEVFGAQNLIIVLPSRAAPEMQQAYESIANQFNREGHYRILKDQDVKPEDLSTSALFFLASPAENAAIPAGWLQSDRWAISGSSFKLLGMDHTDPHTSMLVVERHPENAELAIAYFVGRSPADVQEAGRKLPHYGKYSYLVFYGGKNQVKGTWEITSSPLTHRF